jgi:hypothetical protein
VSSPKEPEFFLERNKKSQEWYRNCFKEDAKHYGEFSTSYTQHPGFPGVPERMHELLPQVKLIYLVRDPIERAVSHYMHNWAARLETNKIEDAFQPVYESWYLNTSLYYYQISHYLEYYSEKDIPIVQSEQLRKRRIETLEEIFRFIGADPSYKDTKFAEEYHISAEKKRRDPVHAFFRTSPWGRPVRNIVKQIVSNNLIERAKRLMRLTRNKVQKSTPSKEILHQARDYLQKDIDQFRTLTGNEFREWSV